MLSAIPAKKNRVVEVNRKQGELLLTLESGLLKITPADDRTVRVMYTQREVFSDMEKPGILPLPIYDGWEVEEGEKEIRIILENLILKIDCQSSRICYCDGKGRILLQERENCCREMEEFPVYRISEENLKKEYIDTPDGWKEVVREAGKIQTGTAYHTRLWLEFGEQEALYGLGQHEEGYHSLRGNRVYLHQANRKIAIPVLVSTKGYGLMINTYGASIFNDTAEGSYFYTEADPEMDYFFMNGSDMDGVVKEYRHLTGEAVILPKWAFGYIQSQERYETQEEILQVAGKYRDENLGLDCIVLDWCSWEGNQWGQKTFDQNRFPDPSEMIRKLHGEHVRFMLSIWPNMGEDTENYLEFREKGQLLPGCAIYDALSADARQTYWEQVERGQFCHGVDAWWCDNSEPFTPEWNHVQRPESSAMYSEYCQNASNHLPATQTNVYGYYHALGIYEGQRKASQEKRVINLTRSGYLGQQRLGTILWSGDIAASWDTLRKQIAAGLHFCASGLPYWTVDIGAFFVRNGLQWFWKGDFDQGTEDLGYCELFTRWYQWGGFLPVFRGHGTEVRRELWNFNHEEAPFYGAIRRANQLRYELLPYIYSLAGMAWKEGGLLMKPLAFGFAQDVNVYNIMDQYLFGDSLMVCPVTEPMYYKAGSEKIEGGNYTRKVYLPEGTCWYDYYTGKKYAGGQWIEADAPLETIPVFVKAGSLIPCGETALSVEEQSGRITVKIYPGVDGRFILYTDAGDGYGYEQGEYRMVSLAWNDRERKWTADGDAGLQISFTIVEEK